MFLMELEFSFSSILLSSLLFLFLFLFLLLNIRNRSKNNGKPANLPPGPRKLPLIGNLHNLIFGPADPPHRKLRHLAETYGPLMHLQLGEISTVVVSSAEYAKEVMKTHDVIFASRPYSLAGDIMCYNSTDIAFSPYGEYWRQLRKICVMELLSMKRVQSFRSIREEEAYNLVNQIANSKPVSSINLTSKIYSLSYSVVSRSAFGKECKDKELFLSILEEGTKLAGGFNIADLYPSIEGLLHWFSGMKSQIEKMHREADQIVENIINDHKMGKKKTAKPLEVDKNEDLVDVLLKVQEDGDAEFRLTTDNIKAVIWDVFSAGSETSATIVDWTMSELMKNPGILKRVQAEVREVFNGIGRIDETTINDMKFLKLVIKETMRLHPPAPLLIPRECTERCEIDGYEIPVKTKVIVNAWAIGRDPKYWSEPESFIPERFQDSSVDYRGNNFEYIPFGAGRRICPGMSFGLANVELLLAMLLYHFDWKLAEGMEHGDLDMSEAFGLSVRRNDDLCVIPVLVKKPLSESHQHNRIFQGLVLCKGWVCTDLDTIRVNIKKKYNK